MVEDKRLLPVAHVSGSGMSPDLQRLTHMQVSVCADRLQDDLALLGKDQVKKKLGAELLEALLC